jgi:ketosteroid isomerase-like protein
MMHKPSVLAGAAAAVAVRAALPHVMLVKLRRDMRRLNAGDYGPLLASFADDAVLHFNEGPHRWSGDHVGKAGIEHFLREFTAAGLQGEFGRLWISGPPWALELVVRFEDEAKAPDGATIYANSTVLWARTRWGKIVEQRDFYADTGRILDLEAKLQELGIPAMAG